MWCVCAVYVKIVFLFPDESIPRPILMLYDFFLFFYVIEVGVRLAHRCSVFECLNTYRRNNKK